MYRQFAWSLSMPSHIPTFPEIRALSQSYPSQETLEAIRDILGRLARQVERTIYARPKRTIGWTEPVSRNPKGPGRKMIRPYENQSPVAPGQLRYWCDACMESFLMAGEPTECNRGHRVDDPELNHEVKAILVL